MHKYRHGSAAIESAATSSQGSTSFRRFVPEIFWKEADEKKYILILTPIDEVGAFDLHDFIPIEREKANGETYTSYESFMSRKDNFIGEDFDKIEDELERTPRTRCMGVGVELTPVMEVVKGRKRPTAFTVKTDTYTRNTEDGEETVIYPLIGIISQSSSLMWSPLNSFDESQGPLESLPLEIVRRIPGGVKSNTKYEMIPFMDVPVDCSPVREYVSGIGYFLEDEIENLQVEMDATDDELKAAQVVARALFEKRIEELADKERYDELLGDVSELPALPWGQNQTKTTPKTRPVRPSQRSPQRQTEGSDRRSKFADLQASFND